MRPLQAISADDLVVTSGRVVSAGAHGLLALRDPVIRALVGTAPRRSIEIAFTYLGPTARTEPLASGELRRQIGVKLRARDTCNVVYAMWHVEPDAGLHVSVKTNPRSRTHAACGADGYAGVPPVWTRSDLPPIRTGHRRTLTAILDGDELVLNVDGAPAWRGRLPASALAFDGPAGLRSDNGEFDLVLSAGPPASGGER